MIGLRILAAGAMLSMAVPVLAGPAADTNAEEFYQRATLLQKKGATAMFDKRMKPTRRQMEDAGKKARAANAFATKRAKPLYCVPAKARKKGLSPKLALKMLGDLSKQTRQRLNLEEAWLRALMNTYPCK